MIDLALASLLAFALALVISTLLRLNVGVVSMVVAWLVGMYLADLSVKDILAVFPVNLFVMLFGITLLFNQAALNGTLDRIVQVAVRLTQSHRALLPVVFFFMTASLSTLGPGNIASVALIAPIAMAIAGKCGISAFLMTIMVANGANAGAFSPFAPTGIIAGNLAQNIGVEMNPWTQIYLPSLLAQSTIAFSSYLLFGGIGLWQADHNGYQIDVKALIGEHKPLTRAQWATLGCIALLIIGVAGFKLEAGFLALGLAVVVNVVSATDPEGAIRIVPWNEIMMVCGVSMLVGIIAQAGGLERFTELLALVATPDNATGLIAFLTGVFSSYSSSSGVVMPAFIPLVPSLISEMGGGDAVALVSSINVGSHVVDVSPLSTLGALCIANAPAHEDKEKLFRYLLINGLSMSIFGALVSYVFFGVLLA
jgi:Na+/H+ antiporter NhaD/arsenite permease-like protein